MKKVTSVILAMMMIFSMTANVFADELKEVKHKFSSIPHSYLNELVNENISEEDLEFFNQQIEAYNPTEEQIYNYVNELIHPEIVPKLSNKSIKCRRDENGNIITPYGILPKMDLLQRTNNFIRKLDYDDSCDNFRIDDESLDTTGVYYMVTGKNSYNKIAAFASLAEVNNVQPQDRPYQMFSFNTSSSDGEAYGDMGLVYMPEDDSWHIFYNVVEVDVENRRQNYGHVFEFDYEKNIYMTLELKNRENSDYAKLRIRDAETWQTIQTLGFYFLYGDGDFVKHNMSTTSVSKAITIAQHKDEGVPLKIDTGTEMHNAEFWGTKLFKKSGYGKTFDIDLCQDAVLRGPTKEAVATIYYDSNNDKWTNDRVSIIFEK